MHSWQEELRGAVLTSRADFQLFDNIANKAHGVAATALLRAFAHDAAVRIYAEPCTPDLPGWKNARPTDLLLLAPTIGALFLEVKGWTIDFIQSMEAGNFHHFAHGTHTVDNPLQQARKALSDIERATETVLRKRQFPREQRPFFDCLVVLPFITQDEWQRHGFHRCTRACDYVLQDDLETPVSLRGRLETYIAAKAGSRAPFSVDSLSCVREALGDSLVIQKKDRKDVRPHTAAHTMPSLGTDIDDAEMHARRLSPEQRKLVEREFDGRPALIRGVAGSGKTVVLAGNCARLAGRLHGLSVSLFANRPQARIAVVCFNLTLVSRLRELIESQMRVLYGDAQPSVQIDVHHLAGLQWHLFGDKGAIPYLRHGDCDRSDPQYTAAIAREYIRRIDELTPSQRPLFADKQYDALYVDEGQDLFEDEYRFLVRLLRKDSQTGRQNIVIFYDDAQNLYGRLRPKWIDVGIPITGRAAVAMEECHRNTRQTVEFAFNVLLGKEADVRVRTKEFANTLELSEKGLVEERPDRWLVRFAGREGDAPTMQLHTSRQEEHSWVLAQVQDLLTRECVRANHILILCETVEGSKLIGPLLAGLRTLPHVQGIHMPFGTDKQKLKQQQFLQDGRITLSTVAGAKGMDAPIVFVVGADRFSATTEGRAEFYVAATRAKTRLYVSGIRDGGPLTKEIESVSSLLAQAPETDTDETQTATPQVLQGVHAQVPDGPASRQNLRTLPGLRHLNAGERVVHPTRGEGEVVSSDLGTNAGPPGQMVRVRFAAGTYTMNAALAGLLPLN